MRRLDFLPSSLPARDASLTPQEAFAGILLVTVAGGDEVSSDQTAAFVAVSNRLRLLKHQTTAEFTAMLEKLCGILDKQGADALLERSSAVLPPELRETAFAVAVDLFADHTVDAKKRKMVTALQQRLGVASELAVKIVEVLSIKNRGS
jgi:hypothetical protein